MAFTAGAMTSGSSGKRMSNVPSGFAFMNLEQDLGLLGLRTAKLSYHPLRLVKKYHVEPA